MRKLKFLSRMDEYKLANFDAKAKMLADLQKARQRAERAKGQVINRSESSTEYKNADGQLIREYNYSEKIVVEEAAIEEQSLGMWLEESPFFKEMKKSPRGNVG